MIFTSFNFLVFFPLLLIFYFITPFRFRWLALLCASYFFYLNIKPIFAIITIGVTISTYIFTRLIDNVKDDSQKKRLMIINIILILLPLFFFKYYSNINNGIIGLLESFNIRWPLPDIKLFLPIGISFYTFMAIGYTVDVYNEEIEAEKNLGILALFISFFPLILSGPIERAKNMLPQFREQKTFDYSFAVQGLKLMLWGYFLKLVVADRVGIYVDAIYNNIGQHNGTTLLFASLLYPFQVYADLGGYSLIAIGTAKVLGINVMFNFNRPFFSTSIAEFWRRWHISLITWLTDYVYTPLAFHFRTFRIWGIVLALMITFFISGIWHGANLTFIVWGLMQGFFLSLEALTSNTKTKIESTFKLKEKSLYVLVSCILTYVIFASSQIFGRATSINDAFTVFRKIATSSGHIFIGELQQLVYGVFAVGFLILIEFRQEFFTKSQDPLKFKKWYFENFGYALLVILILLVGVFDGSQFIYFQF